MYGDKPDRREEWITNVKEEDVGPWAYENRAKAQILMNQAIGRIRAGGDPRPVVITTLGLELGQGERIEGIATGAVSWVMPRKAALKLLHSHFKVELRDRFQQHVWPKSYYNVVIRPDGHVATCESRPPADCPPEIRKQAGWKDTVDPDNI